jgi:type I restriction enzyme R subunit
MGVQDEDLFTSLANRLVRLEKQLTEDEKDKFQDMSDGKTMNAAVKDLLNAYDPDIIESKAQVLIQAIPKEDWSPAKEEACRKKVQDELAVNAAKTFTGELNEYIENVRKVHEQIIDIVNQDKILKAEWDTFTVEKAQELVKDFKEYIEANKDEIVALSVFYDQPHRRKELTFKMIKEVLEKLRLEKPKLAPHYVWEAYSQLEEVKGNSPKSELVALVSLIRRTSGIDRQLTPYNKMVDKNFQTWVFGKQAGPLKFTEDQMSWLRMLKDHIAASFHVEIDDLDYTPFDSQGGRGKMYELFGDTMDEIINELNEVLVA